jgi:hypothetical protein
MCDVVEDTMRDGFSRMAAAGVIGICYDTFREWALLHPEFSAAVKRGQAARTMKLERDLLSAKTGPQVTSRIFALKNAAPEEWRDRQHVQIDDRRTAEEMTDDQLAAIAFGGGDRTSEAAD